MWSADRNNVQPRLGFAYTLNDRTLVRGGVGLFVAPFQINGVPGLSNPINQIGFSRNTLVPVSADNGLTFQASLANPIPSGVLLEPVGSSLGLRTNLGGSPGTVFHDQRDQPAVLALQHRHRAAAAGRSFSSRCPTSASRDGTCRSCSRSTTCPRSSARRATSATRRPRRS